MSMNVGRRTSKPCLGVALAVVTVLSAALYGADTVQTTPIGSKLELNGPATQPAGLPVRFELNLTNLRKEPISYWSGGPDQYPGGGHFTAVITPVSGRETRTLSCFNGQYEVGSGKNREIKSGGTINVPLTIQPLPVGQYDIVVQTGEEKWTNPATVYWPAGRSDSLRVTIKDAPDLAETTRSEWVSRIFKGEPLAVRMAEEYKDPAVIAKLVPILPGDDEKAAISASEVLWHLQAKELPAGTGAAVVKGIDNGLRPRGHATSGEANLLIYLGMVAANLGSDEVLPAVSRLAHADNVFYQARWRAVQSLAVFRQAQALADLKSLTKDKNEWVRSAAAIALAQRKDSAAVPVLLELIKDTKQFREYHVEALANFPDDPAARAAIQQAKKDEDARTREYAERAWEKIERAK